MEVAHLNQKQLAARWCISEATLERWRSAGIGPKFLKLCGRVPYRQADIDVLTLPPRWVFQPENKVETPNIGIVQRMNVVGEPKAGDGVLLQHAIDPALLPLLARQHGQLAAATEQIFNLIQHQQRLLLAEYAHR